MDYKTEKDLKNAGESLMLVLGSIVKVQCGNSMLDGKEGTVTSFHAGTVCPIAVTIKGETHETDFKKEELKVIATPSAIYGNYSCKTGELISGVELDAEEQKRENEEIESAQYSMNSRADMEHIDECSERGC